jgi:murein L,D-transpeptidase YafK
MKIFLLRHFPFNKLSYTAKPHLQESVKPVLRSQSFRALLEVLSSQNGHYKTIRAIQESNWSGKDGKKNRPK